MACLNGNIYPSALKLNDTSISDAEVTFLGMRIKDIDGHMNINIFDKRREFPFRVVRYPHRPSLIPYNIPYGVFTGLLWRYHRICSAIMDFVDNAILLAITLVKQGWHQRKLRNKFRDFIFKTPLRWKHGRQHILNVFDNRLQQELQLMTL